MSDKTPILIRTKPGLYCPAGDFHIDPMGKVARAVITHGHADHAMRGHGAVLATQPTLDAMAVRYGKGFASETQPVSYGEKITLGSARLRLVPAGHILGSAQIVIDADGQRAVAAGDYKRRPDPSAHAFEPVACDLFVTEATFGVPIFRHPDPAGEVARFLTHRAAFPTRPHIIAAYSLGKAQRMIALLRAAGVDTPLVVHKTVADLCAVYERHGVSMGALVRLEDADDDLLHRSIILAPPQSLTDLDEPIVAFASGWNGLQKRKPKPHQGQFPLIISDHADWDELTGTIADVSPAQLWVMYGEEAPLIHHAQTCGIAATAVRDLECAA